MRSWDVLLGRFSPDMVTVRTWLFVPLLERFSKRRRNSVSLKVLVIFSLLHFQAFPSLLGREMLISEGQMVAGNLTSVVPSSRGIPGDLDLLLPVPSAAL